MMKEAKKIPYKIYLEESEMPKEWYNVRADMKNIGKFERLRPRGRDRPGCVVARAVRLADVAHDG